MGLIGNLMVKLGIDTTQFTTGLNRAATSANNFSSTVAGSFKSTQTASERARKEMNLFAQETGKGFKDVQRIAQGIIVSQAFYKILSSIKSSAGALSEFTMQAEQAQIAFGLLMKDTDKAERFTDVLEDFAARTPYTFQQVADNARKLLAYGFSPDSMEPLLGTLGDASAASGDPETFNRVGKALGQIRTKGRLATQEVLQLTEAGIPAFEILRTKLGLTAKEMGNIGHMKIPADLAINAILSGMQERYGGAAQLMAETMGGMLSTIKDNALIIGREAYKPMFEGFKNTVRKIRDASDTLTAALRGGNIANLMKNLIPPVILDKLRVLAASIRMLMQNFGLLWQALQPVHRALWDLALNIATLVLPVIAAFTRVLAIMASWLTSSEPAVRRFIGAITGLLIAGWAMNAILGLTAAIKGLFIVKVAMQLVIGLAQAIRILSIAILTSPLMAFLAIAGGALMYFGLTSDKFSKKIGAIGGGITKAFGADPTKEFVPKIKETAKKTDEFNKKLSVSKESMEGLGDASKKAGKKAKEGLQAFDEVFNIIDKKGADENALDPDLGEISDIGSIPALEIPEPIFPELDTPIDNWVNKFKDTLLTKLKNALIGAGIGALIGALLGGLIGGPEGAKIGAALGALAGALAGYFWDQMPANFQNASKGAGIGAAIGAVIGGILGGPGGALIGAGIGALAGGIVGYFWTDLVKFFKTDIGKGMAAGATIGAIVGGIFVGPVGAAVGAAIGLAIGSIVGYFWDDLQKQFTTNQGIATATGTAIGMGIGGMIGGPLGAALGGIIGGVVGHSWKQVESWWKSTQQITDEWIAKSKEDFSTWQKDVNVSFDTWSLLARTVLDKWFSDTVTAFGKWKTDTLAAITTWAQESQTKIDNWKNVTKQNFELWWANTKLGFATWKQNTLTSIATWAQETQAKIDSWKNNTINNFNSWWSNTKVGFSSWKSNTLSVLTTWAQETQSKIDNWKSNTSVGFSNWWASTKSGFDNWASGVYSSVSGWFDKLSDKLTKFFEKLKSWKEEAEGAEDEYSKKAQSASSATSKPTPTPTPAKPKPTPSALRGHASGGIFKKEHIAHFAEGNKAEAIIPLENVGAMQPFVDAVAAGLSASLGPILATVTSNNNNAEQKAPIYVGTLVADERGLRELNRRMNVIQIQEKERRG